jgi:hypothetical protein
MQAQPARLIYKQQALDLRVILIILSWLEPSFKWRLIKILCWQSPGKINSTTF